MRQNLPLKCSCEKRCPVGEYGGTDDEDVTSTSVAHAETVATPAIAAANEAPTNIVVEEDDEDSAETTGSATAVDLLTARVDFCRRRGSACSRCLNNKALRRWDEVATRRTRNDCIFDWFLFFMRDERKGLGEKMERK